MATCEFCKAELQPGLGHCTLCGKPAPVGDQGWEDNKAVDVLQELGCIPMSSSKLHAKYQTLALVAGYLSVLALFPGGGILSFLVGLASLLTFHRTPEKRGRSQAWVAVVLGLVMTAVWIYLIFFYFV